MFGGVAVYGVLSAEQKVFDQELERKRRYQEAALVTQSDAGATSSGFSKLAASLRNLLRTGSTTEQAAAGV
jgi:hypothetical protein